MITKPITQSIVSAFLIIMTQTLLIYIGSQMQSLISTDQIEFQIKLS